MKKKTKIIIITSISSFVLALALATAIPFTVLAVKTNSLKSDYSYLKEDTTYKEKVEVVGLVLFPTPDNADELKKVVLAQQKKAFAEMLNAHDNQNHKNNAWGLVNAYTDFITHTSIRKGRFDDSQFMNTCFKPMNNILDIVGHLKSVKVA